MTRLTAGCALASALISLQLFPATSSGDDREAREIVNQLVARGRAQDELAEITLELIEAGGRVRERTATFYIKTRDAGNDMRLFRFHSPPDMANAGILTIEQEDRDSDQWLYLPAYHASRRIASANRGDTWMGTDFAYEDMTDPKTEQYEYRMLGAERIGDLDCRIIEAVPVAEALRRESGYQKLTYWVNTEKYVAPKVEFYDREGRLSKRLTSTSLHRYGGYYRWDRSEMHDLKRDHRTVLTFTRREMDQGMSDRFFTVRFLERGR
jgi:hypothetical protein